MINSKEGRKGKWRETEDKGRIVATCPPTLLITGNANEVATTILDGKEVTLEKVTLKKNTLAGVVSGTITLENCLSVSARA